MENRARKKSHNCRILRMERSKRDLEGAFCFDLCSFLIAIFCGESGAQNLDLIVQPPGKNAG